MEKTEAFSVCMSVYGRDDPQWLRAAADSILDQTVPPDEVVLVVDGPVPEPLARVIRKYEEGQRFRVIRLAENRGLGNARRVGLAGCKHSLVAVMDADDICLPDRFEKQLAAFAADPALSVVGGQIREFIGTPEQTAGYRSVPLTDGQIRAYMKTRCPLNHMTVMFRKEAVEAAGGYRDWFWNEDYYLWLRMYLAGAKFANVPDVLVQVRVGADMYQRRGGTRYFASEMKLQNYMLRHKVIGLGTYLMNAAKRLVVQVLLPNRLRGWVFRRFARSKKEISDYDERIDP